MSIPKRKFREVVFQLLYSHDLSAVAEEETLPMLGDKLKVSRTHMQEASERVQKIKDHMEELDQMIRDHAKGYEFERIQRVERNILRLGFYELMFDTELPPKVAIAEAIRLAKKFSTPESVKFVNAVLAEALPKEEKEEDKNETFFK